MNKYNTKPIDFTGCHPVIAEALKRGEAIECKVREDGYLDEAVRYVVSYWSKIYVSEGIVEWEHAEPIARKVKRVMPPERAIPVLIENGWRFNQFGQMENGVRPFILPGAYQMMGCTLEEAEKYEMYWPPCIIEEMEGDE